MDKDKRDREKPIPDSLGRYLNDDQMEALDKVERFGCTLKFVRRPVFQKTIPVLVGPDGETMAIIEETGNILWEPNIDFRK